MISINTINIILLTKFIKYFMTDNTIMVKYTWKHVNHNPHELKEIIQARLPTEVKEWINNHVEKNMDWKSIKSLLRMDDENLMQVI